MHCADEYRMSHVIAYLMIYEEGDEMATCDSFGLTRVQVTNRRSLEASICLPGYIIAFIELRFVIPINREPPKQLDFGT